jgi:hypothetical protein
MPNPVTNCNLVCKTKLRRKQMNITLTSKFNQGDKVHLNGPGGGINVTISSVTYNYLWNGFMYYLEDFDNPVDEGNLC